MKHTVRVFLAVRHFAVDSLPLEKMLVSVRLGQIRLVRFFFKVNCPTAKNPRAVFLMFTSREVWRILKISL